MTELNSKLYLKIFTSVVLFVSCQSKPASISPQNQAVIVLDKTSSVNFGNDSASIRNLLSNKLGAIYDSVRMKIQCSRLTIEGRTQVIPVFDRFDEKYPEGDEDSRTFQEQVENWEAEKRKWLSNEVNQIQSMIGAPCNSKRTDIFSIFYGIQQIQKIDTPWNKVNVLIFSDMTNTDHHLNMLSDITIINAYDTGKSICKQLIQEGQISTECNENLYLTIYTPYRMVKTAEVKRFWDGFFQQWGLQESHYHFEQIHS